MRSSISSNSKGGATHQNRRVHHAQPVHALDLQVRIDDAEPRVHRRHGRGADPVQDARAHAADVGVDRRVVVRGAEEGPEWAGDVVRPRCVAEEPQDGLHGRAHGEDVEVGREELGVDEGCVEWVGGCEFYSSAWGDLFRMIETNLEKVQGLREVGLMRDVTILK
jgi:hypothetical protein